jgi:hypothetical protein
VGGDVVLYEWRREMTPEKRKKILLSWRDVCNLSKDMERKLLQLARHPESTPEQIAEAFAAYKRVYWASKETAQKMEQFGMKYHCEQIVAKITLTEV